MVIRDHSLKKGILLVLLIYIQSPTLISLMKMLVLITCSNLPLRVPIFSNFIYKEMSIALQIYVQELQPIVDKCENLIKSLNLAGISVLWVARILFTFVGFIVKPKEIGCSHD